MSKKYIFVTLVLLALVLAGGGYYFWKTQLQSKPVTPVITPTTTPIPTPVENVPNANPYDKTNPFSNVKVNPFE